MHRISSSFSNMSFKSENLFDFSKDEEDGTISECMLNRKPRKKERIFPASSTVAGKRQFSSSISNKSFKSEYFSDLSEHDEDFKEDLSGVEILRVSGISSGLGHSDDEEDDFRFRQR